MDSKDHQEYLNNVRDMADEAASEFTDDQLIAMALGNLGEFIHDNSPKYILIEDDQLDEVDSDVKPLPKNHSWLNTSIDVEVSPSDGDMAE